MILIADESNTFQVTLYVYMQKSIDGGGEVSKPNQENVATDDQIKDLTATHNIPATNSDQDHDNDGEKSTGIKVRTENNSLLEKHTN